MKFYKFFEKTLYLVKLIDNYNFKEANLLTKTLSRYKKKFNFDLFDYYEFKLNLLSAKNNQSINNSYIQNHSLFFSKFKYDLARYYLAQLNFEDGFSLYHYRLISASKLKKMAQIPSIMLLPEWNFEKKRILLWQDFSIGETILFIRLLSLVDINECHVTIFIEKKILNICKSLYKDFDFTCNNQINSQNYDFQLAIGSLSKLINNQNFNKLKKLPSLHPDNSNKQKNSQIIALLFSEESDIKFKDKSFDVKEILKILENYRHFSFIILNRGESKRNLENILNKNNHKVIKHHYDTFGKIENIIKVLNYTKFFICTSCTEAYLAGLYGFNTIVLYNKFRLSNWAWHQSDSNNLNYWFRSVYTVPFDKTNFDFPSINSTVNKITSKFD